MVLGLARGGGPGGLRAALRTGDADELYADVDGTTVELSVTASNVHGDYWWDAWYYVDERVVRRTTDEVADPRDGELLECRPAD